jgi:hypothetical protein
MWLELLSDELFLLIFSYLDKFSLIYAFTDLNQRFQRIVEPCLYDIDFAHGNKLFYRDFFFFLKHILPTQGHHIRSLKLAGYSQLKLLRPDVRRLVNLESLVIKNEHENADCYEHELNQFVVEVSSISTLSNLSICPSGENVLKTISSSSTLSKLTTFTLIYPFGLLNLDGVSPMPNVKRFSVTLPRVGTLVKLFEVMSNLVELNISSVNLYGSVNVNEIKVPNTLEKLHLEYGRFQRLIPLSSFETLKMFLNLFKSHLRSLTLIAIDADEDFTNFEKFQNLVLNFNRLETFQYYIRIGHQPDWPSLFQNVQQLPDFTYSVFTLPKPQHFDTLSAREIVKCSDLPLQRLFYCHTLCLSKPTAFSHAHSTTFELNEDNLKLLKLHNIRFIDSIEHFPPHFLQKVIALAPNLTCLEINATDTEKLSTLFDLAKRQSRQITYLQLSTSCNDSFHRTFFYKLSEIFPNLKQLKICAGEPGPMDCITSLTKFIGDLRSYFKKLSHLIMVIWHSGRTGRYECYKKRIE